MCDFGLAVDHDGFSTCQGMQVDAVTLALEQQFDAVVLQPLLVHARVHATFVEQIGGDLFEHAGSDAAEHISRALPLDDDVVDACLEQQLAKQQACWAGADDRNLGSHAVLPTRLCPGATQERVAYSSTR